MKESSNLDSEASNKVEEDFDTSSENEDLEDEEESRESETEESDEDKTEDLEEESRESEEEEEEELKIKTSPIAAIKETRYKKFTNTKSKGVDDIQQLPLDWFSKVRQTYKQNQIIPRHKDEDKKGVVLESPTNYKNTEKKNINRLYEDKTNDKNKKTTK
jgi:hypothetical protein